MEINFKKRELDFIIMGLNGMYFKDKTLELERTTLLSRIIDERNKMEGFIKVEKNDC